MFNTIPRSYFTRPSQTGPKVVSIPVHFVGSETKRNNSALKIQKIFRGFLVRKNIKKILSIGREVNEVERKVLGNLDSIKRDSKERLRANETLMSFLFKLDSVQGVGPGVRDCRKAVIKKATALQEKIDSSDEPEPVNETDCTLEMAENGDAIETEKFEPGTDVVKIVGEESGLDMECNDDVLRDSSKGSGIKEVVKTDCCDESCIGVVENEGKARSGNCMESCGDVTGNYDRDLVIEDVVNGSENGLEAAQLVPDGSLQQLNCEKCIESDEDYCIVKDVVVGEEENSDAKEAAKHVHGDDFVGEAMIETLDDEAKPVKGEKETDRELMERMIEENGKMMSIMKQLSEQNQAQTQMLSLLRQRVGNLEKAFVREVSRKKTKDKKKRAANGITDGLDCYPDTKKCGKR